MSGRDARRGQASPRTDDWWRLLRDGLNAAGREELYAGRLRMSAIDQVTGEVTVSPLRPPDWLALEEQLG